LPEGVDIGRLVGALSAQRLEGVVIKRKDSTYLEGEFVIGGYLKRHDPIFDALIVGQYEGDELLYKEKVRFGFDQEKKVAILRLMEPLRIEQCPFANLPERRRRGALDALQMKEAVWVKPVLHCTVEYTEKTEQGSIRGHGRFGEILGPERGALG
jgi:ATP-dependent DNA ligase